MSISSLTENASTILQADLLQFMHTPNSDDDSFNRIALAIFDYQFRHNLPYQRFCRQAGKSPRFVKHWTDIPAVPINAFKVVTLSSTAPESCLRVFMTSGTTGEQRGKHYHPNLEIYDASMRLYFAERFMRSHTTMPMGILFPTAEQLPNSSLAHYLGLAKQYFGAPDSRYFIDDSGLQIDALCDALSAAEKSRRPYALLGASFSFVHLMDALAERQLRFTLPEGSQLFDTGGFKGQSRDMSASDFYTQLEHFFAVPAHACINMYGMTELSSQLYDNGNATLPSIKKGPHWMRTRVVDPLTGSEVAIGETGVIVHTDLANYNSVATLLTEDLGRRCEDGFQLLGRVEGAEAKGCSLAMEEFLRATQ